MCESFLRYSQLSLYKSGSSGVCLGHNERGFNFVLHEFKEKEFLNLPSKEFDQENVTSVEASSAWINSCWLLLIGWDQIGGWGGGG